MLDRIAMYALAGVLVLSTGCAAVGLDGGSDKVISLALDPPGAAAGEVAGVLVDATYMGGYPQMLGMDRPPVRYTVSGGELFLGPGRLGWGDQPGRPDLHGMDITTAWWDFVYWRLPDTAGTYTLSAGLSGGGRKLSVTIPPGL